MKLSNSVTIGAWILISLNLMLAFGAIWVFARMTPAIKLIVDQNLNSLQACEEMLASLASSASATEKENQKTAFEVVLRSVSSYTRKTEEQKALKLISDNYRKAFEGDQGAVTNTVQGITRLGEINRIAMVRAYTNAKQYGDGGAWGVVFMASGVFFVGMLFMRSLKKILVGPLEEINEVLIAHRKGDLMRRCTGSDLSGNVKNVFIGINDLLDQTVATKSSPTGDSQ